MEGQYQHPHDSSDLISGMLSNLSRSVTQMVVLYMVIKTREGIVLNVSFTALSCTMYALGNLKQNYNRSHNLQKSVTDNSVVI